MKPHSQALVHFTGRTKNSFVYPSDSLKQCCDVFLAEARLENVLVHAGERGLQMH